MTAKVLDLRYARGTLLGMAARHQKTCPGDTVEMSVVRKVMSTLYHGITDAQIKGCISFLQDRGLIEPVVDDDMPLHMQDMAEGIRITRIGLAVCAGDAEANGVIVPKDPA